MNEMQIGDGYKAEFRESGDIAITHESGGLHIARHSELAAVREIVRLREEIAGYAPLIEAAQYLIDDGHMNQEHLARLRSAWEAIYFR